MRKRATKSPEGADTRTLGLSSQARGRDALQSTRSTRAAALHHARHDFTSDTSRGWHSVSALGGSLRGRARAPPFCRGAEVRSGGRGRGTVFIKRHLAPLRLLFPVLPGVGKSWVERAKKDERTGLGYSKMLCSGVWPGTGRGDAEFRVWGPWQPPRHNVRIRLGGASGTNGVAARKGRGAESETRIRIREALGQGRAVAAAVAAVDSRW
nr:uncharacterized protein LOC111751309 [Loxodonta africana]